MKYIGIDSGTNTGFAVWCSKLKRFDTIETLKIHRAIFKIINLHTNESIFVRVEDARKRKWFGNSGREVLQGVGSVKRDCSIWEDFLKDYKIPYEMVAPKNNKTKISKAFFDSLKVWNGNTSEHSRDAAMLVINKY